MPSYLVTGASRGLGYEFIRQLSSDTKNTVIGIVRDKSGTQKKVAGDVELKDRSNLHIVQADLIDYDGLKKSAEETAKITGGGLDFLIANAAFLSHFSAFDSLGNLHVAGKPKELEKDLVDSFQANVVGMVHLFNLFTPLIKKGTAKKIISVSTGSADADLTAQYELDLGGPYAITKSAGNMVVAKYSAQYAKEGILFMSVAPGIIDTGHNDNATPEEMGRVMEQFGKFMKYAPEFKGPITAELSIQLMLDVINKASVEKGDGGTFVSQFGNKQWL